MKQILCDYCNSNESSIFISSSQWTWLPPNVRPDLVKCNQCGLIYLEPQPEQKELESFYTDEYAPYKTAVEDEPFFLIRLFRQKSVMQRRRIIESHYPMKGVIIDVGCATGNFLNEMEKNNWNCIGIEPNQKASEYARNRFNLTIYNTYLEDLNLPEESVDVITLWDVLEHVFSPLKTLQKANKLLKKGGLLLINIPNWDSFNRNMIGKYWEGYDPPRHLFVFQRENVANYFRSTGFEIIQEKCYLSSYYFIIIGILNWLDLSSPLLSRILKPIMHFPGVRYIFEPYLWIHNRNGKGAAMTYIAKKI